MATCGWTSWILNCGAVNESINLANSRSLLVQIVSQSCKYRFQRKGSEVNYYIHSSTTYLLLITSYDRFTPHQLCQTKSRSSPWRPWRSFPGTPRQLLRPNSLYVFSIIIVIKSVWCILICYCRPSSLRWQTKYSFAGAAKKWAATAADVVAARVAGNHNSHVEDEPRVGRSGSKHHESLCNPGAYMVSVFRPPSRGTLI